MILGRPKRAGGEGYYGLPFVAAGRKNPYDFSPSYAYVGDPETQTDTWGLIRYAPLPVLEPIIVSELLAIVAGNAGATTAEVRLALVRADSDWQPVGAPIIEETFEVAAETGADRQVVTLAKPVTLEPGLYLQAVESIDEGSGSDSSLEVSLSGQFASFEGSFVLPNDEWEIDAVAAGLQLPTLLAPHTYGALGEAPLPRWESALFDFGLVGETFDGGPALLYPFFLKWDWMAAALAPVRRQGSSVADLPHLTLPTRLASDGSYAIYEQDETNEIEVCVETILRTPKGFRSELPEFGISEQAFLEGGPDLAGLRRAIDRYEPRAEYELGVEGIERALVRVGLRES